MFKFLEKETIYKKVLVGVFLISLAYWGYLIFASQMQISWDAIGYEELGSMIHHKGWKEFLKTGPQREPLYPLTVATSMKIGDFFSISYQLPQRVIQVIFLFITQVLILLVLNKLRVNNAMKLIALLYFGFSPAIVNSGFALYSEIIILPFVVAVVLLGVLSWQAIQAKGFRSVVILSVVTSCLFVLITFGKAIFQHVFTFFLIPYILIAISSIRKKNKVVLSKAILYLLVSILVFNLPIISYKFANKRFNGNFEFTNRYLDGLFGCVARRAEKLSSKKFLVNLASIPGGGVCRLFFSDKECEDCEYHRVDYHSRETLPRLLENTPKEEIKSKILYLTVNKAMENPFQQILLMGFEALKMPFWESTQIGYVIYPAWLQNLFNLRLFKNGLRLIAAALTYCAMISFVIGIFRKRYSLFVSSPDSQIAITCFFILLIMATYSIFYSIFIVITRYSLPIAPLYIISIAYFLDNKLRERKQDS